MDKPKAVDAASLAGWLDKGEVAAVLDCSTRQVEKYAGAGKFGEVKYVRGKRGHEARYNPALVAELKAEIEQKKLEVIERPQGAVATRAAPESVTLAARIIEGQDRQHADAERLAALLESIRDGLAVRQLDGQQPAPLAEIAHKLTLSVAEASRLSGLSKDALRAAIHEGRLRAKVIPGRRGFSVKRPDLDAFVRKL
jgi:excisionase family DNA binding protein